MDDKDARIAALEAELAVRTQEREEHARWRADLADKLHDRETELADERERREAAEALLHEADKDWVAMGYAGWLEFNKRLLTHFARYKD